MLKACMKELIKNISFSCLSPKESNLRNFFVDFMKNWHFHSLKNESNYYIPHVIIIIFCPLCTFFLSANQISNIRFTVSVANLRYFTVDINFNNFMVQKWEDKNEWKSLSIWQISWNSQIVGNTDCLFLLLIYLSLFFKREVLSIDCDTN